MSDIPPEQVHLIYFEESKGAVISHVERAEYMGLAALKGRGVGLSDSEWQHGRTVYVILSHLTEVFIFDNVQAYREGMRSHQRKSSLDWSVNLPRKQP